jgi:hypothetical protein
MGQLVEVVVDQEVDLLATSCKILTPQTRFGKARIGMDP